MTKKSLVTSGTYLLRDLYEKIQESRSKDRKVRRPNIRKRSSNTPPRTSGEILLPAVTRPEIFPAMGKYKREFQEERKCEEGKRAGRDHVEEVTKYKRRGSCAATLTFIS